MSKAERLHMGNTSASHGMVITAVHLDDQGRPERYKVENSWAESKGVRWFVMSGEWFRENVFQVVISKSLADKRWVDVLEGGKATVLKVWDMMV